MLSAVYLSGILSSIMQLLARYENFQFKHRIFCILTRVDSFFNDAIFVCKVMDHLELMEPLISID